MSDLTPEGMAAKLLTGSFARTGPIANGLSDPLADTAMVVTLDQLRPYDLNPRVTRNPRYDDIKSSIRERGLDAPPAITRRPGEPHFIIRNGGNTRLAILGELWSETKDEKFLRIPCLFRPWSSRGEIVALTGHLAENELHGGLSFIERALGVEKARELYEQESAQSLTQTELARRLSADGYPITQSHISRLQDAVRYLLPAIPSVLFAGLGKPQIERLTALRKAAARTWERHEKGRTMVVDFPGLFQDVLALFDGEPDAFTVKRMQDELIGQMAELLKADYDALTLEIDDVETRQTALSRDPQTSEAPTVSSPANFPDKTSELVSAPLRKPTPSTPAAAPSSEPVQQEGISNVQVAERLQAHVVSPAETTDRLQAIQRLVADASGAALQDFRSNVLRSIPVQAGGLHPISDVWYIEPHIDIPDRLRSHIAQLAAEIAQEAGVSHRIEPVVDGIGFVCSTQESATAEPSPAFFERAVLTLLSALCMLYLQRSAAPLRRPALDITRMADDLAPLLLGIPASNASQHRARRLSDAGLVKLFRLIRLARRWVELESGGAAETESPITP